MKKAGPLVKIAFPDGAQLPAHPKTYTSKQTMRSEHRTFMENTTLTEPRGYQPNTSRLHVRDVTPEQMQELVRGYLNYCSSFTHCWPFRTKLMPGHQCDASTCEMIQCEMDVFICQASGNVHLCTRELCRRSVSTGESDVCELTGRSFLMELSYRSSNAPCASMPFAVEPTVEPMEVDDPEESEMDRKVRLSFMVLREMSGLLSETGRAKLASARASHVELAAPTAPPVAPPKPVKVAQPKKEAPLRVCKLSRLDDEKMSRMRLELWSDVISSVFKPQTASKVCLCLCRFMKSLWALVVSSPIYSHFSMTYRPEFHCVLMLYLARTGMVLTHPARVQLIPKIAWLATELPKRGTVKKFPAKQITKTQRLFQQMVAQCYQYDVTKCAAEVAAANIPETL